MEVLGEKHRAECFDLGAEDGCVPRWRRALFPKDTQEKSSPLMLVMFIPRNVVSQVITVDMLV